MQKLYPIPFLRNFTKCLVCCIISAFPFIAKSQDANYALPKIIPVSPNAASLGKYGETPVSLYTGVPNITIPVYEIKTGNISFPISLNYHAGGIKIEEVASWVGLGWSLNAGGVVTRSIAGLDDTEADLGYMHQPISIYNLLRVPVSNIDSLHYLQDKLARTALGMYDGEPDSYFYNFSQYSGKFFYSQEKADFLFSPQNKMKLDLADFPNQVKITAPDGLVYYFGVVEISKNSYRTGQGIQSDLRTAWYLNKIYDPRTQAEVNIEYEASNYTFTSIGAEVLQTPIPMACNADNPQPVREETFKTNEIQTWRIKRISFRDGYILFNKESAQRCDLPGDYALKSITVYNNFNEQIKNINLHYNYFKREETNTCTATDAYKLRLKLDSLDEKSFPENPQYRKPYYFTYVGNGYMVDRLSYAQDYWGYYNNGSIFTMVPPAILPTPSGGQMLPGANRNACASCSNIGSLESITYPTGGRTTFEYESNTVKGQKIIEINNMLAISPGDHIYYDQIEQRYVFPQTIDTTFTIDSTITGSAQYAQYAILGISGYDVRNYSINTGDPNPLPTPIVSLVNLSTPNTQLAHLIETGYGDTQMIQNLPRGTYRLKVEFPHDPYYAVGVGHMIEYYNGTNCSIVFAPRQGFSAENQPVGGIRIKRVIDSDGSGSSNDLITEYNYNNEADDFSSGSIQPNRNYAYKVTKARINGTANVCSYIKRFSYSTYPLVNTQGRPVGYATVTVKKTKNGVPNGKTVYQYTSFRDIQDDVHSTYPFVAPTTYDYLRGLLKEESYYRYVNSNYNRVKKVEYEYKTLDSIGLSTNTSIGMKTGWVISGTDEIFEQQLDPGSWQSPLYAIDVIHDEYNIVSDNALLTGKIETTYDNENTSKILVVKTDYNYSKELIIPNKTIVQNSKGDQEITTTQFSGDYRSGIFSDNASLGISNLHNLHIINEPVEVISKVLPHNSPDSVIKSAVLKVYNTNAPTIAQVFRLKSGTPAVSFTPSAIVSGNFVKNAAYEPYAIFTKYDANGNILQMSKAGDVEQSYIWDYYNNYVVAEAQNASYDEIAYTGFEAEGTGNWTFNPGFVISNDGISGNRAYNLNDPITKSGLNSGKKYILSFWAKSGAYISVSNTIASVTGPTKNGWTYYQKTVANTNAVRDRKSVV